LAIFSLLLGQAWRTCIKVIDGDTIVLDGKEKVRLIGVDTPETKDPRKPVQYFGEEAYRFTKSIVEGKRVRLEHDRERIDKYGRTLAYVYLEDGTFLNAEIIKQGYGFAYTKYPFKYMEEFRRYEREARENRKGLWADEKQKTIATEQKADDSTIVYITKTGLKYHLATCNYLGKNRIPITLKEACEKGYSPCSRCNPPPCKQQEKTGKKDMKRERKTFDSFISRTNKSKFMLSIFFLYDALLDFTFSKMRSLLDYQLRN